MGLLERWDDEVADRAFAMNMDLDEPRGVARGPRSRRRSSRWGPRCASTRSGRSGRARRPHRRWWLRGERGWLDVRMLVSPEPEPRIQALRVTADARSGTGARRRGDAAACGRDLRDVAGRARGDRGGRPVDRPARVAGDRGLAGRRPRRPRDPLGGRRRDQRRPGSSGIRRPSGRCGSRSTRTAATSGPWRSARPSGRRGSRPGSRRVTRARLSRHMLVPAGATRGRGSTP